MDQETVNYIITYFSHQLSEQERLVLRHIQSTQKLAAMADTGTKERMQFLFQYKGWLVTDKQLLERLADGPEAFLYNTAVIFFNAHGCEKLLNLCPNCARLARTPNARQCRHCGHDWH